jgi:hypothetical protein
LLDVAATPAWPGLPPFYFRPALNERDSSLTPQNTACNRRRLPRTDNSVLAMTTLSCLCEAAVRQPKQSQLRGQCEWVLLTFELCHLEFGQWDCHAPFRCSQRHVERQCQAGLSLVSLRGALSPPVFARRDSAEAIPPLLSLRGCHQAAEAISAGLSRL